MAVGSARGEHLAEAVRQAAETRARSRRERGHTRQVAEAVAATQDHMATLMDELAQARPADAVRLRELGVQARQQAEAERHRARGYACAAPFTQTVVTHPPATRAADRVPAREPAAQGVSAALSELFGDCTDGAVLADRHGVIVWSSRRLEEMFGYQPGELMGSPVEVLVPRPLRVVHRRHRSVYQRNPKRWLSADRAPLAGLRKDGTIISAEISLSPVHLASGSLTLALVGEAPITALTEDLAGIDTATIGQSFCRDELVLLDRVVSGLFEAGLSLQASCGSSDPVAEERVAGALDILDGVIRDIRDHVFRAHERGMGRTG